MKHKIHLGKKTLAVFLAVVLAAMTWALAVPAAVAEGEMHTVTFRILNEKYEYVELRTIQVRDGETIEESNALPDKSEVPDIPYNKHYLKTLDVQVIDQNGTEEMVSKNSYKGWTRNAEEPVTKDITVDAVYVEAPKIYKVTLHDYYDSGEILKDADGNYLRDLEVPYGDKIEGAPTDLVRNDKPLEFAFEFTGDWETAYAHVNKTGETFKADCMKFDEDASESIDIYAVYHQRLKRYPVNVVVVDRDNVPVEGAKVQVSVKIDGNTNNAQVLASGDKVYGETDKDGKCRLEVAYSSTGYVISATWPDDDSQAKVHEATVGEFNTAITLQLSDSAQYHSEYKERCTHICHSFLGGLYITGLNLLYRLFHVKYVCCYDMYATHGDKLAYTP